MSATQKKKRVNFYKRRSPTKVITLEPYSDDNVGWRDGDNKGCIPSGEGMFMLSGLADKPLPIRVYFHDGWKIELTVPKKAKLEEHYRCNTCEDEGEIDAWKDEEDERVLTSKECPDCLGDWDSRPWPPKESK